MFIPDKPLYRDFDFYSRKIKIDLLKEMLKIRLFEEYIADLLQNNKLTATCHLYIGQEASAVGICSALKKEDYMFGNHRSHGHFLAKGGDMKKLLAEIYCKKNGCSGGRGGSMHLCDPDIGILGTSSIVAGNLGIGIGAALAEKIRGTGRVSVIFHGDGVVDEGIWHEALNFAALKKLPVIFVCENNLYCTHLPIGKRRIKDNFVDLARNHGLTTYEIDGNNVLSIYYTADIAVKNVRNGCGPQFIECKTYRWVGHIGQKDDIDKGIRDKSELDFWKDRCPVKCFYEYLLETKNITEIVYNNLIKDINGQIYEAEIFAKRSAYPHVSTLLNNVFVKGQENEY